MKTEDLTPGQMLLISAKAVNGGKVSLEFAQIVETGREVTSLTSLLNASDERFGGPQKPRHAWIVGMPADIQKNFGIDVSELALGDVLEINQLNPMVMDKPLNIRLTETVKGSEYDLANIETKAKRAGKDGDFILTSKDEYIFTKVDVVAGPATHYFIEGTKRQATVAEDVASAISDVLGKE